jgi:exopolysaccharide biosynthesis polyprenyl glycosylphosphotransferase
VVRRYGPPILGLQFILDIVLTLFSAKIAEQLRLHVVTGLERREQFVVVRPWVYFLIAAVWICFLLLFGAFHSARGASLLVDLSNLWLSLTTAMLVLASIFYLLALQPPDAPSRLFYVYFYFVDLFMLGASRILVSTLVSTARRRGRHLRRVLLVGGGVQARHVAVRLKGKESGGVSLVGYVSPAGEPPIIQWKRLGDFGDLKNLVREAQIDEVIIALPADAHEDALRMNAQLQQSGVSVHILPDVFEMMAMRARVEDFYGLPLVNLSASSMNPVQANAKRLFDLTVAAVLFVLLLPFFLAIALWIKLDSRGPILIHQRRVGAGGKIFRMHKFRTMAWAPSDIDTPFEKRRNDPRVTRAGRVLRRTSIDELPQLWNVLTGEMSLVGPRPELPALVEDYEPWQRKRFTVPPGMTGWWQINGRSEQMMHLNTEADLFYVQNYSILLDVQILLRTLSAVVRGKGAY